MKDTKYCNAYKLLMIREAGAPRWEMAEEPPSSPTDVAVLMRPIFEGLDRELFVVLALNARNVPVAWNKVSMGSVSASIVHPREVFKFALMASASSIILAHNHPSGDPSPSKDDLELTRRLVKAGQVMGIEVLDHLIFGVEVLSLKEKGLM